MGSKSLLLAAPTPNDINIFFKCKCVLVYSLNSEFDADRMDWKRKDHLMYGTMKMDGMWKRAQLYACHEMW